MIFIWRYEQQYLRFWFNVSLGQEELNQIEIISEVLK